MSLERGKAVNTEEKIFVGVINKKTKSHPINWNKCDLVTCF
ncbi:hypothetical protein PPBDW_II0576 [Photobacterium kishitanii]|nr:hypothetical protein PPBDW_II0576 [Photobacterium kishitanii]